MIQINSYFTFNGNCREAMCFYKTCFGGELSFQTIGESPLAEKIPDTMKNFILHATLSNGNMVLMGSDMVSQTGLIKGNSVSLSLNCSSEEEIRTMYNELCREGRANNPLKDTHWGALFGDLTDKYGNHWLLNYNRNNN